MLGAPTINHLLFVGDILIFCKTNLESSNNLMRIIDVYAQAFGQCINTEKTTIVFSKNVGEMVKIEVFALWGCRDIKQYEQYLVLSPISGCLKKSLF